MKAAQVDEKAVFNEARRIADARERERFLATACREDTTGALDRVRALLRAFDEERSFLESPAPELESLAPARPFETVGSRVGPYRLLEEIGEGGFGVVFLAEQTEPVRRRVALKV